MTCIAIMKTYRIIARAMPDGDVFQMDVEASNGWIATLRFCTVVGYRPSELIFCAE